MNSDNLNCSQLRALYKYVNDGYVIINSGRRSGKTTTLMSIVDYWIEHQAKNNEICIIVCRDTRNMVEFRRKLLSFLEENISHGIYIRFQSRPDVIIKIYTNIICYIDFCRNLNEYFRKKQYYIEDGVKVSLLVGDELYIEPDWCEHTACAYTQYHNTTSLSYDEIISKEEIARIRKTMSKSDFDREFGQYL